MKGKGEQHPTPNVQRPTSNGRSDGRVFDLEERMLRHAARIVRLVDSIPSGSGAKQVGMQLVRSGTSPYLHHGEVEAAESRADFIHKLKVCLKELRETWRALRLIKAVSREVSATEIDSLIDETHQLIRIFWKSTDTVRSQQSSSLRVSEDADFESVPDWMLDVERWVLDVPPDSASESALYSPSEGGSHR